MTFKNFGRMLFDAIFVFCAISLLIYLFPIDMASINLSLDLYIILIGTETIRTIGENMDLRKGKSLPDPWWISRIGIGTGLGAYLVTHDPSASIAHIPFLVLTAFAVTIVTKTFISRRAKTIS